MQKNKKEGTLCHKCKFMSADKRTCLSPDLSPSIWAYVEPLIETRQQVQAALSVCDRDMLKEHRAAPHIAPAVTAISGTCSHYASKRAEAPQI